MIFNKKRDLLIVVGGGSLPPQLYDRPHEDELQPNRDRMEEQVIHYCVAHGIPIIATCRGMQYINVMFGGKLWYHPKLPDVYKRQILLRLHICQDFWQARSVLMFAWLREPDFYMISVNPSTMRWKDPIFRSA